VDLKNCSLGTFFVTKLRLNMSVWLSAEIDSFAGTYTVRVAPVLGRNDVLALRDFPNRAYASEKQISPFADFKRASQR